MEDDTVLSNVWNNNSGRLMGETKTHEWGHNNRMYPWLVWFEHSLVLLLQYYFEMFLCYGNTVFHQMFKYSNYIHKCVTIFVLLFHSIMINIFWIYCIFEYSLLISKDIRGYNYIHFFILMVFIFKCY